jgi:serine/threonine-protein kinase HipA
LNVESAFPISLTIPLRLEPYSAEIATPWFANLLPEGRELEGIGRFLGRSEGDVYGLLEEIGLETAGALAIGGPEPIEQAQYRDLSEPELSQAIERLPQRPLLIGEQGVTMSLAGAQSKMVVAIFDGRITLPLYGAASTHILKPESDRLYATVENEFLCMTLAARIGFPVAQTEMATASGRRYLLVQRYDRHIVDPGRVRRAHQEDFCQLLKIYPTAKYEAAGGPRLFDLFRMLNAHSRRPARDRLTLLDFVILACCIGDTDRHGKNYAILLTEGGPRLAPGYDFMSALVYDGITRNLAMKVAGKNRAEHLQRRHWERFAQEVALSPAGTVHRVERLATKIAALVPAVAAELSSRFPADPDALQLFSEQIRERSLIIAANSRRGEAADPGSSPDSAGSWPAGAAQSH